MIRALTLDLDDTLWAIAPVITRAEAAQHAYLREHCPRTAERYSIEGFRVLRETVARERHDLSHDFTEQRLIALRRALEDSGDDVAHAPHAFDTFFVQRNRVDLYDDVPDALARLAARRPLAALTNGNADLGRVGLGTHFRFSLGAREHGAAKPEPSIFHAACQRLGVTDLDHAVDGPGVGRRQHHERAECGAE